MNQYFVLLLTIGAATAIQKVPVTIYYETLCADSMAFFTKQFTPTWRDLKSYIDLELVPFGKSNSTNFGPSNFNQGTQNVTWTCHHGPNECVGNKLQSCLVDVNAGSSIESKVNYIDCLMTNAKIPVPYENTARTCANSGQGINAQELINCAQGSKGDELLLKNEQKTRALNPPLKFVPTIIFHGHFNQAETDESQKSFRSVLCKHITESPKPAGCDKVNGAQSNTSAGLMTLLTAALFFHLL